ncbi:hypothetical protein CR513_08496, partial [Mucuna pruriens]
MPRPKELQRITRDLPRNLECRWVGIRLLRDRWSKNQNKWGQMDHTGQTGVTFRTQEAIPVRDEKISTLEE